MESYKQAEYRCDNCEELWEFFPEDYNDPEDWPTICPHCEMPVWDLIKSTYVNGGFSEVFYWLRKRYF